jgi:2-amino-4-hydroxy-6-hydroxymethyldihydropteridine diphosphokinase
MPGTVLAYIGLGSNLGECHVSVLTAMDAIADLDGLVLMRKSSLYGSAPIDALGADFVNAVVEVQTVLKPRALLAALQALESRSGRQRSYRNAPRTLDLDILLFGGKRMQSSDLVLPHPRMWERAFVLQPLAELIPDRVTPAQLAAVADQPVWRHPGPT